MQKLVMSDGTACVLTIVTLNFITCVLIVLGVFFVFVVSCS